MATDILKTYIPKFLVELNRQNEDIITVTTNYFSPSGDAYQLDKRAVSPIVIQTTQSLSELKPEISTVYPFRAPVKLDYDNSTLLQVPSVDTVPTSSQDYYVPIYFERYKQDVVLLIDKEFTELTV
jgi:hypothetical protein